MTFKQTTRGNFNHFISLIYPNLCIGCQNTLLQKEQHVCNLCLNDLLPHINSLEEITSIKNRVTASNLENLYFLFWFSKKGLGQNIVNNIKYFDKSQMGFYFGQLLGRQLPIDKFDVIIPTPIHKTKLKKRGYNQALIIAQGIQAVLKIPIENNYLSKKMNTNSQTKKSRKERWENASTMFERPKKFNEKKYILLVDDVLTSGATTSHCIQEIEKKHIVSIATLAVAKDIF